MLRDFHHPNFPPNLSITPNVGCFVNTTGINEDGEDAFGAEAQQEAICRYGIAGRVWEAAPMLCAYVGPSSGDSSAHDFDPPFVDDPRAALGVIELGSGTGVVAASVAAVIRCAATPGGFVIATDLPDVCPLLEHNLGVHASTEAVTHTVASDVVWVRPLAWGNFDHAIAIANELGGRRLTHLVCSDLVYFPELLGPLLRTLIHITALPCASLSGLAVKIVISYKIRSLPKEAPFWSAFGLWFSFQPVLSRRRARWVESETLPLDEPEPWRQFGEDQDGGRTFIFVAHRRSESIAWRVPETDKELLEGVCARGTPEKKGDDTFETMLLMSMGIYNTEE